VDAIINKLWQLSNLLRFSVWLPERLLLASAGGSAQAMAMKMFLIAGPLGRLLRYSKVYRSYKHALHALVLLIMRTVVNPC
jgi:hypothetical protein